MTILDDPPPSVPGENDDPPVPERRARLKHTRMSKWMHWINFPLLTIMIWSGFRIYYSDRQDPFGVGIGGWHWFDLFPDSINETLGFRRKLARGLAFHLTFGWFFAINGIVYGIYSLWSGRWRRLAPAMSDFRDSIKVVLYDLKLTKTQPERDGDYNSAQRITYSLIIFFGFLMLLSGFAIYKPTQLSLLVGLFFGYENARFVHFWVTMGFLGFFVIHIIQVFRAGFGNFWSMVSGYELDPKQATNEQKESSDV